MMAKVIVLLACIFILSKSKLFFKIQFFKAFMLFLWSSVILNWQSMLALKRLSLNYIPLFMIFNTYIRNQSQ